MRPSLAVTQGPACGEHVEKNEQGQAIQILFAKNGSVQRYVIEDAKENMESVNDFMLQLEQKYGKAAVNAPPLRIVSFKPGAEGMQIPDKAVDSCGRTLSFQ